MSNLFKMTVGKKLIFGFLGVGAIGLVIGIIAWFSIDGMEQGISNMATNRIPDLQSIGGLNRERMAIRAQTLDIYLEENSEHAIALASYRRVQEERETSWARVDEYMNARGFTKNTASRSTG